MSATNPATSAMYPVRAAATHQLNLLHGSFQGAGATTPTVLRGSRGFTIARIAAGQYRVTLRFPPLESGSGTASNNQGLTCEPQAWVTSESVAAGAPPATRMHIHCGRVTPAGAFDIWVYDLTGAAAYDVTTADRINFRIGWKAP